MSKVISAGIIVKMGDRYVLGHATNQKHWDIFKGRQDEGETFVDTAIRECKEESGLIFEESEIHLLGKFHYTKNKDIVLFIAKRDVQMSDLICKTFLENNNPEMDYYASFSFDEMIMNVGKSMSKLFQSLETQIKEY